MDTPMDTPLPSPEPKHTLTGKDPGEHVELFQDIDPLWRWNFYRGTQLISISTDGFRRLSDALAHARDIFGDQMLCVVQSPPDPHALVRELESHAADETEW